MAEKTIHLVAQDGFKIAGSVWPATKSKCLLLWLHGYAEHRRRYGHFGNWMADQGVTVAAIDVRGHGESDGKRGHVGRFEEYFYDLNVLIHWSRENFPKTTCLLGSHSHGGLILARYLEEGSFPRKIEAAIFSAPFVGIGMPVPDWKMTMANSVSSFVPKLSVPTGLPPELVSHDERIVSSYRNDPLVFKKATTRWFTEAVKHQEIAIAKAGQIKLPTLVMQGLDDKIASVDASRRFFAGLGGKNKKWIEYPGFYHEIMNEIEKERVYKDMFAWIKKQI